ncbi:hypothetical protein REPUB_Repub11eG0012100 [Reevesia pubescens]
MEGISVRQIKSICVFCGSNLGKAEEFVKIANNLGRVLVARKIHLVYGGGSLGLMVCAATAAHLGGSKVLGVILRVLAIGNIVGKAVGDEIMVSCIHERMNIMLANTDTFIDLPSGFGTLEEIFQIVSWSQLNILKKKSMCVNGFYDRFSFLNHAVE